VTPAIVYFPPGTYVVSKPIVQYYYSQFIGDATDLPVLKAAAGFQGMAVVDSDPYTDSGDNWFTNQNNFFRQIRNFVIDLTAMPQGSGAGIHWQVGQATSLQNIRFEMVQGGGDANKQQGIFMDNGSGGFMTDLTFNGGNYGVFLGNQQFTTRNLTFNGCNTAIFMNWNWAWTFKSVTVKNCAVALNMSNSPQNQTVGSVLLLDSTISTTNQAIVTAWTQDSIPNGGGALVLDNVDFTGSKIAVAGVTGNTILNGGSVIASWVQGNTYSPGGNSTVSKRDTAAFVPDAQQADSCPAPEVRTITVTMPLSNPEATSLASVSSVASRAPPAAPAVSSASPTSASPSAPGTVASGVESGASGAAASAAAGLPPAGAPAVGTPTTISVSVPGATSTLGLGPGASSGSPAGSVASSPAVASSASASPTAASSTQATSSPGTCANTSVTKARTQGTLNESAKPAVLVDGSGKVFERSKPQYETVPASSFVSVKSAGAKGDGTTDDTAAIQKVLDGVTSDQIVFFDHGAYIITSTIKVPKDIKIVGEIWPLLMASGEGFGDEQNPIPMLQIGQPGDRGNVEISDIMLETKGSAPGAILMEWNVAEASQGSAGMWDVHFRIGGSAGTELQSDTCAKNPTVTAAANPKCVGAFMLFHVTKQASAYVENSWFWVADHELDLADHNQIDIYNGRGVLIESQGPVWMYGTSSEHSQLYEYQLNNAKNVYMAMIQTETPYVAANFRFQTPHC
jgi:glucan 1,3-beta-glucosidase